MIGNQNDFIFGLKMGDFLFKKIEKIFPFLMIKNDNHLSRTDIVRLGFKTSFLVGISCLIAVEILLLPIVLFNSTINKLYGLFYVPFGLSFMIFSLLMLAGLISAIRWNVERQDI